MCVLNTAIYGPRSRHTQKVPSKALVPNGFGRWTVFGSKEGSEELNANLKIEKKKRREKKHPPKQDFLPRARTIG